MPLNHAGRPIPAPLHVRLWDPPAAPAHAVAGGPGRVPLQDRLGHSFGGLFGLVTLFRQPTAFRRYLIISPSLWWDNQVILRHEQAWAESHDNLPARLFIAVGGREQAAGGGWKNEGFPDEAIAAVRQVDNCRELCTRLDARQYPGLSLECVVLDGEYHLTVAAAAITRGLISLFSGNVAVHAEQVEGASARG